MFSTRIIYVFWNLKFEKKPPQTKITHSQLDQQLKCSGEVPAPPVDPSGPNIALCILSETILMMYCLIVNILIAILHLELVIFHHESQKFRPSVALMNKIKICLFL